ncbi:Heterokaryon incompatibility [Botryosphaeria dothidea]|uniref:Heterokaryon incompatibility n=1 Tax=Botryosphaeria dothidea TaxID=55169 RepID=A0A8H4N110_9PEZI|nr:Heterokaryon incompatibility [Botryosphaeria dothidea]
MITRFLGIQYLWIDSLCIIQDSAEDWNREAATMGSVYCNATVTIAADGAANGKGGCFRDLAGHGNTLALDCTAPDGTQTKVFVRPCVSSTNEELQFDEICHSFSQHGPQSSLDNRAWVLQERLLSRQILHYTNLELAWECDITHHCECSLSTKASNFRHTVLAGDLKKTLQRPRQEHSKDLATSRESPFDWALIVQNFTARSLTQPRDRLPALSGMAELRSLLTGDEYVCGLWKRNISKWLWWKPAESSHESRRLEPYYAPTWSWASVTGSIWYQSSAWNGDDGVERFSLLQDVNIEVESATSSKYAAAKSGSLAVTGGGLTPCHVSFGSTHDPRPPKRPVMPLKHPELGAVVESKTGQRRIITWEPDVFFEEETPGSSSHLEVEHWSFEIEDGSRLFLFPTIRLVGVRGLVLEPVVGSAGEYRRVGSFWDSAEEFGDLLEPDKEKLVIV